jgi:hypothetical protein
VLVPSFWFADLQKQLLERATMALTALGFSDLLGEKRSVPVLEFELP